MLQAHLASPFFLGSAILLGPITSPKKSPIRHTAKQGLQSGIDPKTPTRFKRADELVGGALEETANPIGARLAPV